MTLPDIPSAIAYMVMGASGMLLAAGCIAFTAWLVGCAASALYRGLCNTYDIVRVWRYLALLRAAGSLPPIEEQS